MTKRLLLGIVVMALLVVALPGCGEAPQPKVSGGGNPNVAPMGKGVSGAQRSNAMD
jgi:hypothetical protein